MLRLEKNIKHPNKKEEIKFCRECGYPTISEICAFCKIKKYFTYKP